MIDVLSRPFKDAVADAASKLVRVDFRGNSAYVDTPLLYPSGGTVVIRIDKAGGDFFVSDMGLGYDEADLSGLSLTYMRYARVIAEGAGVGFDSRSFFVARAVSNQLAGAVATVANCSQEAVALTMLKHAERKSIERAEKLYVRLVRLFHELNVEKHGKIVGASSIPYDVDAIVKGRRRPIVFEVVANQHTSVYAANSKFHDLRALERPPVNVAVVRKKRDMGTYVDLLSQAAEVIEDDISDDRISYLANAA